MPGDRRCAFVDHGLVDVRLGMHQHLQQVGVPLTTRHESRRCAVLGPGRVKVRLGVHQHLHRVGVTFSAAMNTCVEPPLVVALSMSALARTRTCTRMALHSAKTHGAFAQNVEILVSKLLAAIAAKSAKSATPWGGGRRKTGRRQSQGNGNIRRAPRVAPRTRQRAQRRTLAEKQTYEAAPRVR